MIRVSTPRRFILSGTKRDRPRKLLGLHSRARTGNPDLECHPYAVVAQFDPVDEHLLHIDLQEVSADRPITVRVSIHPVGEAIG